MTFVFGSGSVTIHGDGKVEVNPKDMPIDEAARRFWKAVEINAPKLTK